MATPRYHLVWGKLKVRRNIIKNEKAHAETNPGFSDFKNELTIRKMIITSKLVRIALNIELISFFI